MQNSLKSDDKTRKKRGATIAIIVLSVVVILMAVALVWALTKSDDVKKAKYIEEATEEKFVGTKIVFEPDVVNLDDVTDEQIVQAMDIIAARLDTVEIMEKKIERQEDYAIAVIIPDVDDPNEVVNFIGQTAKLQFMDANGVVVMEGDSEHISKAEAIFGQFDDFGNQGYYVELKLTEKGREVFKKATEDAVALKESGMNYIAICLDGIPYSMPSVNEVIDSDKCVITGDFTKEDAEELASVVNAGRLPFSLKCTELVSIKE